jgi:putative ABC transport system permease protein
MRIVRQLLTESFILVVAGGTLGLAMGAFGIQVISDSFAAQLSSAWTPRLEPAVVVFTLVISVAAGLTFGILPAIQTLKRDQGSILSEGGGRGASAGPGRRLLSRGLVVAEIALSMVALGGGSVMVRGFLELQNADPGFEVANLLTLRFSVPESKFPTDEEKMIVLDEVVARAKTIAGVRSVTLTNALPQNVQAPTDTFRITGELVDAALPVPRTVSLRVDPGYLETMGVPLQQGRFLEETDRAGQPLVAVINRAMVDKRFEGRSPLGQLISIRGESREIVGVVADVSQTIVMVSGGSSETVYLPIAQVPLLQTVLVLATTGDPGQLAGPTRTALGEVDPDLAVNQVQTMEQFVDQFFVGIRVFNSLLSGFGALALLLASLGTYGVLAYSVGQRRHEIGVRMALGAREGQVTRMVVKQGLWMAIIGLTIGTVLVVPLTLVIRNLLEGLATVRPITVVAVGMILFAVTMIASVVPARRAAGVDPVDALRAE